jgi:hypothetical protein
LDYAANQQIMQLLKSDFRQIVSLTKDFWELTLSCCKAVSFAKSVNAGTKYSERSGDIRTPDTPLKLTHFIGLFPANIKKLKSAVYSGTQAAIMNLTSGDKRNTRHKRLLVSCYHGCSERHANCVILT